MLTSVKLIFTHFTQDSLYRNSIYLMLSTAVMAFFGFFFWLLAARLYSPESVGLATAILSIMTLIAGLSNLGLSIGIIHALPKTSKKNEIINSSLIVTTLMCLVISLIFLLGINIFAPRLIVIKDNFLTNILFLFFSIFFAINIIVESLFIAFRSSKYILIKNTIFSISKLIFPIFFISLNAIGLFISVGLATFLGVLVSLILLVKSFKVKLSYKFQLSVIKNIAKYSFVNYVSSLIIIIPSSLLPLIITQNIGPKESAYFYIALMIANLIYVIPTAVAQSLFAEGAHFEENLIDNMKKSVKIIFAILLPVILITVFFGDIILTAFGKSYSGEAFNLLKILALTSIFISINSIAGTLLRVKNRIYLLTVIGSINVLLIMLLSFILLPYKLTGIGFAWLLGHSITSVINISILRMTKITK